MFSLRNSIGIQCLMLLSLIAIGCSGVSNSVTPDMPRTEIRDQIVPPLVANHEGAVNRCGTFSDLTELEEGLQGGFVRGGMAAPGGDPVVEVRELR